MGIVDDRGDSLLRALLALDDLDQRHLVHGIEEVHAEKVLGALQVSGQRVDGNTRSIRRNYRFIRDFFFRLGQNRFLDLGVFDDGFDHRVDVAEVAVGERGTNARHPFGHLRGIHLAALDALGEMLGGLLQTLVDGLFLDVLHQDRHALVGGLVGDTTTHDAGAENRRLLDGMCDLAVLLALLLDQLIVEEQLDQGRGLGGLGQLDEAFGFFLDGRIAVHAGSLGHAIDRLDRRGIHALGLTEHETLGRLEGHRRFGLVELERRLLLGLAGLPVELTGDRAFQQIAGGGFEFVLGDDRVDHAGLERLVGTPRVAVGNPFDGVVGTDQARRAYRAAEAGIDTELGFRKADLGLFTHHAIVGGQTHFQAAAERHAVDRGHAREIQVLDGREHAVGVRHPLAHLVVGGLEALAEFHDVGADDECRLGRFHQQALDVIGMGQRLRGLVEIVDGGLVELVDRRFACIETQHGDPVGDFDRQF